MSAADPVPVRPARRVAGPSALGDGDLRRCWNLALTLALNDWKIRFFGSALGYVWSLLRPLLLFGILYLIFSEVVRVGEGIDHYPVVLLLAMMLHFHFAEVTGVALTAMVDRETLLRKVGFPRVVVPLAVIIGALWNLGLNLLVLAVFLAISGVPVQWTWLLVPLPLALLTVFAAGVGMLLSAVYVRYRDVKPIWEVALQALFYATPILYPIELVLERSETLATVLLVNPVAAIIQESRHLLVGTDATPSLAEAIGSSAMVAAPCAVLAVTVIGGLYVFDRLAPGLAEDL